jgi:hypothetical protein
VQDLAWHARAEGFAQDRLGREAPDLEACRRGHVLDQLSGREGHRLSMEAAMLI